MKKLFTAKITSLMVISSTLEFLEEMLALEASSGSGIRLIPHF